MTKKQVQELWMECLGVDNDIEVLTAQLATTQSRSRAGWKKLEELYLGKSEPALEKIWKKNFDTITRNFYKDITKFPDAFEPSTGPRSLRWHQRRGAKKYYFMQKMRGVKKLIYTHAPITSQSTQALISRIESDSNELIVRYETLTVDEMKRLLKQINMMVNVLYRRKHEIKTQQADMQKAG